MEHGPRMQLRLPRAPYDEREMVLWHGTSEESARAIVEKREFNESKEKYDWLANGAYFFTSENRARQWATKEHPSNPAVVRVIVRMGHHIDLDDNRWTPSLEACKKTLERQGIPLSENRGKYLPSDARVVKELVTLWRADTVSRSYGEGDPIVSQGKLTSHHHTQVCVRNQETLIHAKFVRVNP